MQSSFKRLLTLHNLLAVMVTSGCEYNRGTKEVNISEDLNVSTYDWWAPTLAYTIARAKAGDPVAAYSLSEYYGRELRDVKAAEYWGSVALKNDSFEAWRDRWNALKDSGKIYDKIRAAHFRTEAANRSYVLANFDIRKKDFEEHFGAAFVARLSPDPLFGDSNALDSDIPSLQRLMIDAETMHDALLADLVGGYLYRLKNYREAVTWFAKAHSWGAIEAASSLFRIYETNTTIVDKESLNRMLKESMKKGSYYSAVSLAKLTGNKPTMLLVSYTE